jgi:hypothetical protein
VGSKLASNGVATTFYISNLNICVKNSMYCLVHVNGVVQSIFIDPNARVTPNLSWQTPLVVSFF